MLFVCPSAHHRLSTSRWEQTNNEMERQEDRHFLNLCNWRNIGFYNHANVNNHHHRRRFASWFLRRSVVAVRSGRDVILRKRLVLVSIAPVPSLCYQFSCTVSYSSWSDSSIPRHIYSHHKHWSSVYIVFFSGRCGDWKTLNWRPWCCSTTRSHLRFRNWRKAPCLNLVTKVIHPQVSQDNCKVVVEYLASGRQEANRYFLILFNRDLNLKLPSKHPFSTASRRQLVREVCFHQDENFRSKCPLSRVPEN